MNVCLKSWTIHQIAQFQVWIFKIFWGGLLEPSPQIPSPLNLGLCFRFGLRPQISGASRPRFGLHPQSTPNMFDHFSKQGELDKIFHPSTSTSCMARPLCFITRYTYILSYIAGRPERTGRPGPPQYFRQVGAYDCKSSSFHPIFIRFISFTYYVYHTACFYIWGVK